MYGNQMSDIPPENYNKELNSHVETNPSAQDTFDSRLNIDSIKNKSAITNVEQRPLLVVILHDRKAVKATSHRCCLLGTAMRRHQPDRQAKPSTDALSTVQRPTTGIKIKCQRQPTSTPPTPSKLPTPPKPPTNTPKKPPFTSPPQQ
jgi:hypothetical protein